MKIKSIILFLALTFYVNAFASEPIPSAKSTVETAINNIIKIVETYPGKANTEIRRKKLRELIEPLFDFNKTAEMSLGSNWDKATKEEKEEYIKVYTDHLARTYLSKIETVERGMVTIDSERLKTNTTIVYTTVTRNGDKVALDYKMKITNGAWKVYDVVVAGGIGLVEANRTDFGGVVRMKKISGLIELLKEKNSKVNKL